MSFISQIRGALEGLLYPSRYAQPFGVGPFNGQELRKKIYLDIMKRCSMQYVVETGSFRGTTTSLFSDTVPKEVHSCELHPRFYSYTKMRYRNDSKVIIYNSDSRAFLKQLTFNTKLLHQKVFFYLDAHWNADLPLKEEVEIILSHWKDAVIMVDDFKVPEDVGYRYDDYGGGNSLDKEYLEKISMEFDLFFPISSEQETGQKRGSVILCANQSMIADLEQNPYIVKFKG